MNVVLSVCASPFAWPVPLLACHVTATKAIRVYNVVCPLSYVWRLINAINAINPPCLLIHPLSFQFDEPVLTVLALKVELVLAS